MSPPQKPPASVLAALGLTGLLGTAMRCSDDEEAQPCLDVAVDPATPPPDPSEPHTGPCLEFVPDPPPPEEPEPHLGPCLKIAPPRESEPHVGPCLKFASPERPSRSPEPALNPCLSLKPPEPAPEPPDKDGSEGDDAQGRLDPVQRVLGREVLPSDVAALLRARQRTKA